MNYKWSKKNIDGLNAKFGKSINLIIGEDERFYIKSINNERIEKNYSKKRDHEKR
ncbi:9797_t:CDS:2 [Rhizophagus irregularis]|nr:9797_t:CDS:2 [Rhizophagus irregularis]